MLSPRQELAVIFTAMALSAAAVTQVRAEGVEAPAKPVARHAAMPVAKKVALKKPAVLAPAPVTAVVQAPVPAVRVLPAPTEREVAALFEVWNAAIQTGSPEIVASLYAPDAVLLPTVSNRVRTTRYEITDYFQHFLALQPRGTVNQSFIRVLSPDLAMNAGVYTFDIVKNGKPEQVTARYDFLYKRVNGRWQIAQHHSSAMPEKDAPAPMQHAAAH